MHDINLQQKNDGILLTDQPHSRGYRKGRVSQVLDTLFNFLDRSQSIWGFQINQYYTKMSCWTDSEEYKKLYILGMNQGNRNPDTQASGFFL